jgi:hypothetical protein
MASRQLPLLVGHKLVSFNDELRAKSRLLCPEKPSPVPLVNSVCACVSLLISLLYFHPMPFSLSLLYRRAHAARLIILLVDAINSSLSVSLLVAFAADASPGVSVLLLHLIVDISSSVELYTDCVPFASTFFSLVDGQRTNRYAYGRRVL